MRKKTLLFFILIIINYLVSSQNNVFVYDESGNKMNFIEIENIKYVKFNKESILSEKNELIKISEKVDTVDNNILKFTLNDNKCKLFENKLKSSKDVLYSNELIYLSDSTIQWCFNDILVQIKPGFVLENILKEYHIPYINYKQFGCYDNEYLITILNSEALKYSNVLFESKNFYYSIPAFYRKNIVNNPLYSNQWGLKNTGQNGGITGIDINIEPAWEISTGNGIKIAVLDNGVQLNHPDLQQNLLQGYDATG